ncbi:MAG: hypothetical protein ABFC28_05185 [Rikenellaceae bacterium]
MKKSLLIFVALFISLSAFSQNYSKSIGLRMGSSIGASYKKFLTTKTAFETILDMDIIGRNHEKIKGSGYYLYHFDVNVDGLSLYAGPGASAGVFVDGDYKNNFVMSFDGMGGIEYKFNNTPIVLACDWTPKFQFITNAGIKSGNFGLTVRFTF